MIEWKEIFLINGFVARVGKLRTRSEGITDRSSGHEAIIRENVRRKRRIRFFHPRLRFQDQRKQHRETLSTRIGNCFDRDHSRYESHVRWRVSPSDRTRSKKIDHRDERNVGEGYLQFQCHLRPRPSLSLSYPRLIFRPRSSVHPFIRSSVCTTNDERFSRDCYRRVGYRRRDCGPMPDEERKFACSRAEAQTRKMTDGLPGSQVVPPSASRRHLESTKAAISLDGSSPFIRVCCFQIATMERIVWKQCVATLETICFWNYRFKILYAGFVFSKRSCFESDATWE